MASFTGASDCETFKRDVVWHFRDFLKLDGDKYRILKSRQIFNPRGVRAKTCFFLNNQAT